MQTAVVVDSGVLGALSHPKTQAVAGAWAHKLAQGGNLLFIPEIADYEVRRELIRLQKSRSIRRLDYLISLYGFIAIDTDTMPLAAEFWAQAHRGGYPTADDKALDGDVILAAQARLLERANFEVMVATTNRGHLQRFVAAQFWLDFT
jgi:toxin FitB